MPNIVPCHRLPERSFFYKGKQFPVCARCTGVFIGRAAAFISFWWLKVSVWIPIAFMTLMFLDWGLQHINVKQSTNVRRLITGMMGGYGLVYIALYAFTRLVRLFM